MQKRCDFIDDFDDLMVSKAGFDITRQKNRRSAQRDIVRMESMKEVEADGRHKRTSLLSDLAHDLTSVMGECPAKDLPLTTYSRRALAIYKGDKCADGSAYPASGSQEGCTVAPSQASDQVKKGPASHRLTLDPNYTKLLEARGLIELPADFTGRKAPANVWEKDMSADEQQYEPCQWATWWKKIGGFQARHKCTTYV